MKDNTKNKTSTTLSHSPADLILIALFSALTAVFSQIAVPLPFTPVPINLATLAFMLSGSLLGASSGFFSQLIFLLLGFCGLPVFAEFSGGPGVLFGPTGGYLVGYAIGALVIGFLFSKQSASALHKSRPVSICIFLSGLFICYFLGTVWYMYETKSGLLTSFLMCVPPFLPGEVLKIAAAVLITERLPHTFLTSRIS